MPLLQYCVSPCVYLSSSYIDSCHTGLGAHLSPVWSHFYLINYICNDYFQIKLHSEVPGLGLQYTFSGNTIQPITDVNGEHNWKVLSNTLANIESLWHCMTVWGITCLVSQQGLGGTIQSSLDLVYPQSEDCYYNK